MLRFGICTEQQYRSAATGRIPAAIAYNLLPSKDNPTDEQVRIFEEITLRMRTSNGTFRTSFTRRFEDLDAVTLGWIQRLFHTDAELHIQDRAASHCLTSQELAQRVFATFPNASFEASDRMLHLLELRLPSDEIYILEPDGQPLQYIRPPLVVSLSGSEARRYPVNRLIAAWAAWRFKRMRPLADSRPHPEHHLPIRKLSCVHPRAAQLAAHDARFRICERSAFDATPASCHVLRTMNIFHSAYFSRQQLASAVTAAFQTIRPNGLWIVGRTLTSDSSNHATLFMRSEQGWQLLDRIGTGSEIEELIQTSPRLA